MARIRSIKPEILEDEKTAGLSDAAYRLFTSAIFLADDFGNLRADDRWLTATIWWARGNPPNVAELLREVSSADLVTVYVVRGQRYMAIRSWLKHQRIDNAGKARVPGPSEGSPIFAEFRGEIPLELAAGSRWDKDKDPDHRTLELGAGDSVDSAALAKLEIVADKAAAKIAARNKPNDETAAESTEVDRVLAKLSVCSGRKYGGDKAHRKLVLDRLRDGNSTWDCRRVIAYCAKTWKSKPDMQIYLRPTTLFGPEKFASYIGDARIAFPDEDPDDAQVKLLLAVNPTTTTRREVVLNGRVMFVDDGPGMS